MTTSYSKKQIKATITLDYQDFQTLVSRNKETKKIFAYITDRCTEIEELIKKDSLTLPDFGNFQIFNTGNSIKDILRRTADIKEEIKKQHFI